MAVLTVDSSKRASPRETGLMRFSLVAREQIRVFRVYLAGLHFFIG
jgi:hypothetical protein